MSTCTFRGRPVEEFEGQDGESEEAFEERRTQALAAMRRRQGIPAADPVGQCSVRRGKTPREWKHHRALQTHQVK